VKAYKVELLVIDYNEIGAEGIRVELESAISDIRPEVISCTERDIGEWSDDHPLNHRSTLVPEYRRLFAPRCWDDDPVIGPAMRECYEDDKRDKDEN
jgi:hypothetical protein